MDAAKAKADAAKAQAKAKVDEGVQKAKVAAGMAPRDWETGICGCCEDFGGCESPAHASDAPPTHRVVLRLTRCVRLPQAAWVFGARALSATT
jgi:hypothetical protein